MIPAVIVDDEPLARARLRRLLGNEPDVEVLAEHADGESAMVTLAASRYGSGSKRTAMGLGVAQA